MADGNEDNQSESPMVTTDVNVSNGNINAETLKCLSFWLFCSKFTSEIIRHQKNTLMMFILLHCCSFFVRLHHIRLTLLHNHIYIFLLSNLFLYSYFFF